MEDSIITMARGAVIERIDMEMQKVVNNINDLNTDPTKKRSITIKVDFKPSNDRMNVQVSYQVSSHLEPATPLVTSLYNGVDAQTGECYLVENTPNIPGQMALSGGEQEPPKVLKFAAN